MGYSSREAGFRAYGVGRGGVNRRRWAPKGAWGPLVALAACGILAMSGGAQARTLRLIAFGDSLTAGYGLAVADGFTAQLGRALSERGYAVEVVNAGVSGDTTAGGLSRLGWTLADRADAMIVELGANDMLRGLDPDATRANLDAILKAVTQRNIPVLLTGMRASPTLGRAYAQRFDAVYPELAARHAVAYYPFFLEGVAADPALNQGDGIHPNANGVRRIVEGLVGPVTRLLDQAAAQAGGTTKGG